MAWAAGDFCRKSSADKDLGKIFRKNICSVLTAQVWAVECRYKLIGNQKGIEMSIFEDTAAINAILNQLADEGMVEPMAEPIDCDDCHPLDAAFVMGIEDEIFDEMYPDADIMVDTNGERWYVA